MITNILAITGAIFILILIVGYFADKKQKTEPSKSPEFKLVNHGDPLPHNHLYRIMNKRTGEYAKTYFDAVTFGNMDYNSYELIKYQVPKIEKDREPTGKYLELYEFVMSQELTKQYLRIFPFGLQFLFFDGISETYAFNQFCQKYPSEVGKMFPIMHLNNGKDTVYLVGDESFLLHQELDVTFDEFIRFDSCQQLWDTIIKTEIEANMV